MRIGITGSTGKVGQRLLAMGCVPLDCDVTDFVAVQSEVQRVKPDVICHLASLSDVDFCEKLENAALVSRTNLRGTWHVAQVAEEAKCGMVLLSTDHVFDGKRGPYKETDHPKNPVNFYGQTKMAAEAVQEAFKGMKIVRTSYLFNWERIYHVGSPLWWMDGNLHKAVPTFLKRSFMYEGHFADSLFHYLLRWDIMPPVLHISGSETVSWYEFILAAASVFGHDKKLVEPRKKELKDGNLAPRPHKAGLNTKLSAKFLRQYSYIEGLMELKAEQG